MFNNNLTYQFPKQKVSAEEKAKPYWYTNSIDYIIGLGISMNDRSDTETKIRILHGELPQEFYRKTLNPYNASKERFKNFPATLRNYDIMSDIIRRYIGEYFKNPHDFVVGANNPDIVFNRNAALKQKVMEAAQKAFQQEFQKRYQAAVQQAEGQGQSVEAINPQDVMPDPEEFMNKFNQDYIDNESKQGQDILNYIRDITNDLNIYLTAFFNYCAFGECYTYTELRGDKIIKECVPLMEAYPIPNSEYMIEDHDMFARKMKMSYNQILDAFDDYLDDNDRSFLDKYYNDAAYATKTVPLRYDQYFEHYANVCDKFTDEERRLFRTKDEHPSARNGNLYEVWHVVWKGFARQGILTFVNQLGFQEQRVVEEDYELNKEAGDISIEWEYKPQVYEGYRIGTRFTGIYPVKARPILYERKGKLPYNGIMEILPYMGKFSIIKLITPYQIMRNIFAYHREMVIAKNKMLILLLPESLIASNTEDKLYKMAADGVLLVDDDEDSNGVKMQQIRMLNASMGDYVRQITDLMEATKLEAREMVDMNMQRYGDIAQSAGAATTQEAITRSSMGMVILVQMFDEFRKHDYNRDLDYCKLAYIDGLDTSYWDALGQRRFISLDVNSFVASDYSTTVRNDQKELDKLQQLRQWAFSAAQNGDLDMALAAISGDNVTQIKATVEKFMEIKRQHEEQMQQIEQMLKQEELQNKIAEIQAKGEEDRKTEELKYYYEMQLKYVDVDMSLMGTASQDDGAKTRLQQIAEANKNQIEQQKLQLTRQQMQADLYNKAADRQVKREDMTSKEKIAKMNKNKYDK